VGNRIFGLTNTGRPISGGNVSRLTITGNIIAGRYGVELTAVSDATISNNLFSGDVNGPAVSLVNCSSVVVSRNAITSYAYGVRIYVSSGTSDYFNISNNHLRSCTVAVDSTLVSGGAIGANIVNAGNIVRAS
jgi:hypothetical protein